MHNKILIINMKAPVSKVRQNSNWYPFGKHVKNFYQKLDRRKNVLSTIFKILRM